MARRIAKTPAPLPFGPLRFLYTGTSNTARDAKWYVEKAGAKLLWHKRAFGADPEPPLGRLRDSSLRSATARRRRRAVEVAALDVGGGPLLLLADHRKSGTVLQIYEVADLKATVAAMATAGWEPEDPVFEVPNGPCRMFKDPSGNEICLLEETRPDPFG